MDEYPRRSCIAFGCAPAAINRLAQVWRREERLHRADRQVAPADEPLVVLLDGHAGGKAHGGAPMSLDHGHERLLRSLAKLEEAREVAALAQLGDGELELAGARVPARRGR